MDLIQGGNLKESIVLKPKFREDEVKIIIA